MTKYIEWICEECANPCEFKTSENNWHVEPNNKIPCSRANWHKIGSAIPEKKPKTSHYCEEGSRHACMNDPSKVNLGSGFRRM